MKVLCLLLSLATPVLCQDRFGDDGPVGLSDDDKARISAAASDAYQTILARWFRQEVEAMRLHLKLSDADAKRLQLAGKGAVSAMVKQSGDRFVNIIERKIRGAGIEKIAITGVPIVSTEEREEKAPPDCPCDVTILVNYRQTWVRVTRTNGVGGGSDGGRGFGWLLQQDIWVRTRDKILSKKQQASYAGYKDTLAREHLAVMLTGKLALQLRLGLDDRDKLQNWISKQVMSMEKLPLEYDPGQLIGAAQKKLDFDTLKGTLSEDCIASLRSRSQAAGPSMFQFGF